MARHEPSWRSARVLGREHERTLSSRNGLAYALLRAGFREEASKVAAAGVDAELLSESKPEAVSRTLRSFIATAVAFLRTGKPIPPHSELAGGAVSTAVAVLRDMEAGQKGSAEALARLPAELRSLVEPPSEGATR